MKSRCCSTLFMLKRILHIGPLMALFVIFTCAAAAMIDCMLWTWTPSSGMAGKINLFVFLTWIALILKYFFSAILIGPGIVPLGWMPEKEEDCRKMQFCVSCKGYKPLRAHHCRVCKHCVMKMDHHCPWINNCVGLKNHTSFVLFLFFAPVGCMHALIVYCVTLYNHLIAGISPRYFRAGPRVAFSANAILMNIIAMGLALGTVMAVSVLFYQQFRGILRNQTGIEDWIVEKARDRPRDEDEEEEFVYPYNYGWKENLRQVFNWKCTPIGDGYTWPVTEGCSVYALSIEQLKQKQDKQQQVVVYVASDNFSGRFVTCSKGLKTSFCVPCTDEPRIRLQPDEEIYVTRATKYWLYGEVKTNCQGDASRRKGWFPRNCATRIGKLRDLKNGFEDKKNA